MSLLNDMLRDLSQSRRVADGAEGYDDALLESSSIAQKQSQSWFKLILLFVVIFISILGVNYAIHKFLLNNKNSVVSYPEKNVNTKSIATEPHSSSASTFESNKVSAQVDSGSPALANNSDVNVVNEENTVAERNTITEKNAIKIELQNHIDDLMQQADRAIGMDRLTAPIEDNAYGYYQKILAMDANNTDAKEGLDNIASRLLVKAQEQVRLGNSLQAETLVQRARFVSARYVQAHEIVNDANNVVDSALQEVSAAPTANQTVQPKSETIKPFVVAEAPAISVSPNPGWKDEQMAQHAQKLLEQGQQAEAQAVLKKFIAAEKSPALSVALLAEIYIQQANTTAANIVVEQASYLPIDVKAKLEAQILSVNGDDAQAIALLEKNLSAADNNEGYRSLLASLYHKTANYQQSIISYQRLNNTFGEKPAYWLGLALAYDGLSQRKSALQAYQHLREFPQLQTRVIEYTDQRIAALRSE